jgi:cellobiose phosphorylase
VLNPEGKSKGVKEMWVDQKQQSSNIVPVFGDGKEHNVTVVLG